MEVQSVRAPVNGRSKVLRVVVGKIANARLTFSESIHRYLTGPQPYSKTVLNHTVKFDFYIYPRGY